MSLLLGAVRDHLVTEGIVRRPNTAGSEPPLWVEPQRGTPGPGERAGPNETGSSLVIGLFLTGGIPTRPYESEWIYRTIQFVYRANGEGAVMNIENTDLAIRQELIDKRDWMLNGTFHVLESGQTAELSRLGSDAQGYDFRATYWFQIPSPTFAIS